jgi:hypothetical protein
MNYIIFLAVVLTTSYGALHAQQPKVSVPETILALKSLDNFGMQGAVNNVSSSSGKIMGTVYLNDEWANTTLKLTNQDVIPDFQTKYNLYSKVFEIKAGNDVKVLEAHRVSGFSWDTPNLKPRIFISERMFDTSSADKNFYEVLSEGGLYLLKRTDLSIKRPDYSVQFNVGSKDSQLIKTESLYYINNGKIDKLPRSKNAVLKIFGHKRYDMQKYISDKSLNLKEETDIKIAFDYYNQRSRLQ